jgi:hypothetical protein
MYVSLFKHGCIFVKFYFSAGDDDDRRIYTSSRQLPGRIDPRSTRSSQDG